MKRKTALVILGIVLSVLLGQSLAGTQPSYAYMFDCEMDRFNAFMNANDQYTTTFRSWYFSDPISCQTQCTNQCNQLATQAERDQCMANLSTCVNNCDTSRFNSFTTAEDNLMMAASMTCSYNPDFCGQARALRDQCNATFSGQMENPVLDENEEIDGVWLGTVTTEFWACRTASGIDSCE